MTKIKHKQNNFTIEQMEKVKYCQFSNRFIGDQISTDSVLKYQNQTTQV